MNARVLIVPESAVAPAETKCSVLRLRGDRRTLLIAYAPSLSCVPPLNTTLNTVLKAKGIQFATRASERPLGTL